MWAEVGIQPREQFIQLPRIKTRLRVQETGDGPPIVFIHGVSNTGTSWSQLVREMPGYRCLLIDRPGCALSETHGRRFRDVAELTTYAEDLVADVFDALELDHAFLVGTSFGGNIVLRATAVHPERVRKLVCLGWSVGAPIEYTPFSMRMGAIPFVGSLMFRMPATRGIVKAVLKQVGLRDAIENGMVSDAFLDCFRSLFNDTDTMANERKQGPPIITPIRGFNDSILIPDEALAAISVPTYFLWGASDPMGGEAVARAFAAKVPGATLELMPGGHAVWVDDPKKVADVLSTFFV
jgi:pimeloyl-ACP methyl ester carboxylesterase